MEEKLKACTLVNKDKFIFLAPKQTLRCVHHMQILFQFYHSACLQVSVFLSRSSLSSFNKLSKEKRKKKERERQRREGSGERKKGEREDEGEEKADGDLGKVTARFNLVVPHWDRGRGMGQGTETGYWFIAVESVWHRLALPDVTRTLKTQKAGQREYMKYGHVTERMYHNFNLYCSQVTENAWKVSSPGTLADTTA